MNILKDLRARVAAGELSQTALADEMRSHGLNKLYFALDPTYWGDDFDFILDIAGDIMHLYGCGISRKQAFDTMQITLYTTLTTAPPLVRSCPGLTLDNPRDARPHALAPTETYTHAETSTHSLASK